MNRFPVNSAKRGTHSFTLVEILVAIAVFAILMVVMAQLLGEVSRSLLTQQQRMTALGETRFSLDRLTLDWSARVRRPDVNGSFTNQPGNDQISFVTQVPAYSGTRAGLALVSYRIGTNTVTNLLELERGIAGFDQNSGGTNLILSFPYTPPTPPIANAGDYEQISAAVFRMEFCFLTNGASGSSLTTTSSVNLPSTNLVGLVVAMAALDENSRKILTPAQMTTLVNALADVTNGVDPQSMWLQQINNGTFLNAVTNAGSASVPVAVAGAVRVYQRVLLNSE